MTVIQYLQSDKSEDFIARTIIDNIELYRGIDTDQKVVSFSGTLYNYFVNECVLNNQYLTFSKRDYSSIQEIYIELIKRIRNESIQEVNHSVIKKIVKEHRASLIKLLSSKQKSIDIIIPCAEYSKGFQQKILRIEGKALLQPIMDIGCGQKASLVKEFRGIGLKAYGIDQYISKEPYIICENWLNYCFDSTEWGTIIAHMSFSNHFRKCITYKDREFAQYKEKYFEIIRSLKKNGSFIYCPSIPEIENEIDKEKYDVIHYKNNDNQMMDTIYVNAARI